MGRAKNQVHNPTSSTIHTNSLQHFPHLKNESTLLPTITHTVFHSVLRRVLRWVVFWVVCWIVCWIVRRDLRLKNSARSKWIRRQFEFKTNFVWDFFFGATASTQTAMRATLQKRQTHTHTQQYSATPYPSWLFFVGLFVGLFVGICA